MYEFILSGGKKILGRSMNYPIVRGMWWTRFERIARWLVDTEQARRSRGNIKVHSEEWISCDFNASFGTFTINAKVDRMEVNDNGSVWLVDYKTGTPPSDTKIAKGYAPQMTLEAAIVQGNGIAKKVESLEYWRITGGKETANIRNVQDHEELIENTKENLFKVMEAFADEETPYLSQPNPDNKLKYNDYEHLARNKEWAS
jgi:ATP-dependent helicase/nuclease subunit B